MGTAADPSRGVDLADFTMHPGMVRWFRPSVLLDAARRAVVSAVFGAYADRRLLQAALDQRNPAQITAQFNFAYKIAPHSDGTVWIDYVADLGDGFDSTYAIAYLLGRKTVSLPGGLVLPRGQALIMGGDEVYPTATKDEYARRLRTPYGYSFPDSRADASEHPPLFLIPGNHDWYDGLTLFLALFCRGRPTALGSWRACQSRSYFAVQLPGNWFVWGIDTQLGEDVDKPQSDYFVAVARQMPEGAKVILCSPVPTWTRADISARTSKEWDKFQRGINYVALDILGHGCPSARICAVLSGDMHHYSRYSATETGTQFITAGGGGAFLHPTHHLKDRIDAIWLRERQWLSLTTAPDDGRIESGKEACFPPRDVSRRLSLRNFHFAIRNFEFGLFLGVVYAVCSILLTMWHDDVLQRSQETGWKWMAQILNAVGTSPMFLVLALLFLAALGAYTEHPSRWGRWTVSAIHTALHLGVILTMVSALPVLLAAVPYVHPGNIPYFLLYNLILIVVGGLVGGTLWGIYLVYANFTHGRHYNGAFSALRIDGYKNFLRMRLKDDNLTIYPVGLESVPTREAWRVNERARSNDQNEPKVVPTHGLDPVLIEGPIVIDAARVAPVGGASRTRQPATA